MRPHDLTLDERLGGAVLGHLVGDAVGVPYEFTGPHDAATVAFGAAGTWRQPAGTWSDDGALMLALLDSLLERDFDPEDQGRRALAWYEGTAYTPDGDGRFDVGNATAEALRRIASGVPAAAAGATHERSKGNGSLMRILPLALVEREVPDGVLVEHASVASGVTHGTAAARVTCALYVLLVARLLRGDAPKPALERAIEAVEDGCAEGTEAHATLVDLLAYPGRTGSAFVFDAFWSAWEAFSGADDYAGTIRRAVAFGNDTDTTAAIAGGLAGAHWGWGGIPVAWRRGMRGQEVAGPLIDRLVERSTGARTSRSSPLRVDEVCLAAAPALHGATGRLGITFLPGKKRTGWSGPHWRDLDLDVARLRELGWDALYLLNEDEELSRCHVPEIEAAFRAAGTPALVRHPIPDPQIPTDDRAYGRMVREIVSRVRAGGSVAIACRGGMDRSGMTASCVLVEAGMDPEAAMARVQASRRCTITKPDQRAYVRSWPHTG
jgi:ADP-ribosylglycohydrolase